MSAARERLGKAALLAAGLLLGLALCEVYLRLRVARVVQEIGGNMLGGSGFIVRQTSRGKRLIPNVKAVVRYHGLSHIDVPISTNSLGLRDREIPHARTSAGRILVLGDSFTAGLQVELDEVVAKRVERALNAPDPPGTRVEVVNAGVSAWGTDNALLYFLHEGWRYRPDVVVLMFNTGNDILENERPLLTSIGTYPDKQYYRLVDGTDVEAMDPGSNWRERWSME